MTPLLLEALRVALLERPSLEGCVTGFTTRPSGSFFEVSRPGWDQSIRAYSDYRDNGGIRVQVYRLGVPCGMAIFSQNCPVQSVAAFVVSAVS